jgi:hypothetical protein
MLIALAFQLMAFIVLIYILMAVVGWNVLKFIFGWGKRHINWTQYPNINGILFIVFILGGWLLISAVVGMSIPAIAPSSPWERVLEGMGITGAAIIGLGLIALAIPVIVSIIKGVVEWLFEQGR